MIIRKMGAIVICALSILFIAADGKAQGHDFRFKVAGLQDSVMYLGYHFGENRYVRDTTKVTKDGTFVFKGNDVVGPGIYFLYSPSYYFEFIVSEQNFTLSTSLNGGYKDLVISGSKENEIFKEFQLGMIDLQQGRRELMNDLAAAPNKEDSTVIYNKLSEQEKQASTFRRELANKYTGSFVSQIVWLMERPKIPDFPEVTDQKELTKVRYNYYKEHYFDNINLKNPGLLKTPVMLKTVTEYIDEIVVQNPDSLIKEVDWLLAQVAGDDESFRFWLVTFFSKYQQSNIMGMDALIVHLAEKYYITGKAKWVNQDDVEKLKDEVSFLKPNLIGNKAPYLQLLSTELKPLTLNDIKTKYVILYFYDPDCGHCKKKTPVLLEEYHKMKGQGVEVMGICTTTDIDKWKKYVEEGKLDWVNAADPYYRSNFRKEYNVRSTPQVYILDKDRKIVAKKLDVEQIADFIANHRKAFGD